MTAPEDFISEVRSRLLAIEEHDHDEHDEHDDGTDFAECSACKAAQDALWWLHSRRVQLAREVVRLADEKKELGEALRELLPYLPDRNDVLNYAASNGGSVDKWHVASIKARTALQKAGLL